MINTAIAARAIGAVLGVLAVLVFAACTPNDRPADQQGTEQQSGY